MNNYYIISIKGNNIKYFYNRIINNGINIYESKQSKKELILKVDYEGYEKIKKFNTIYQINVIKIYGIKSYKQTLKFYKLFILFFIINLFLILIYSNMIFKITIDCQNKEIEEKVKKELKNEGITIYSFKKTFAFYENLKTKIKNNNKNHIEWLEINCNGVYLNISIIERKQQENNTENNKNNIIANKTGIIKDMYITSGEILKNKGDYVSKGEVIVSSNITKQDEVKNTVDAKGQVFAEVWYLVRLNSSFKTTEKISNGTKTNLKLKVLNKDIKLFSYNNKSKPKVINLFKNSIFTLYIENKQNYLEKKKEYDEKSLLQVLETTAKEEIEKTLEAKEKILLQKTLKNTISNDKMYVEVFFKVYEDIAEYQKNI